MSKGGQVNEKMTSLKYLPTKQNLVSKKEYKCNN